VFFCIKSIFPTLSVGGGRSPLSPPLDPPLVGMNFARVADNYIFKIHVAIYVAVKIDFSVYVGDFFRFLY